MTDADAIRESLVNAATFAVLFDRHYRAVHRFLRARIGAALAEDLASETFTPLHFAGASRTTFRGPTLRPGSTGLP